MSVNDEIKRLQTEYAARSIDRRQLFKGLAALGIGGAWLAAIEKGALAAPAHSSRAIHAGNQDAETLIIAVAENIDTWDPGFTVGSKSSQTTIQNTFDQLTQYTIIDATTPDGAAYKTVDTTKIIGMIASEVKMEGADMIFTLGNNVTYSNGDPVDAHAMKVGYDRIMESGAISSALLGMGGAITGADNFVENADGTFTIKMSVPNVLIPQNNVMHNTAALDPKQIDEVKTDDDPWGLEYFRANLGIGNGPYKLDSYKPDDSIVLVANDTYYGEAPFFKKVVMKIVADATQRVQLLKNGDVDTATKIPFSEYQGLTDNADIKTLSIPSNLVVLIEMNTTIAPFDKKEVRQAVAYATPYADIITQVYLGQAGEAKSLLPSGMPSSDPSTYVYTLDLEKAKSLLETAGFPNGEGLPDINLVVPADDQQKERIAIILQDSLKKIGMNVQIQKLAYAQYNELEQGSKLQIWVDEWISWVNDPFYHLFWLAQSSSPSNYPKFSNARVDELIQEFLLSDDTAGREAASKEIQGILNEESPYIYVAQPNWIIYFGNDIDGYVYYNDELPRYALMTRTAS